jgi:hypothetical protein
MINIFGDLGEKNGVFLGPIYIAVFAQNISKFITSVSPVSE